MGDDTLAACPNYDDAAWRRLNLPHDWAIEGWFDENNPSGTGGGALPGGIGWYPRYFNEWHERDLTDLIVRDRNHPSIFIRSIGNEVLEQWTDAKADTLSLEEANLVLNFGQNPDMLPREGEMSVNSLLTKKLADVVKKLAPMRPVTAGCNEPNPYNHLFRSGALDVIGNGRCESKITCFCNGRAALGTADSETRCVPCGTVIPTALKTNSLVGRNYCFCPRR